MHREYCVISRQFTIFVRFYPRSQHVRTQAAEKRELFTDKNKKYSTINGNT